MLQIDKDSSSTILNLEKAELNLGSNNSLSEESRYEGNTVCFTGQLSSSVKGQLIDREFAHSLAIEKGLIVKKGVSKKLDLLVVADPNSQSSKARKARDYGVKIIAEAVSKQVSYKHGFRVPVGQRVFQDWFQKYGDMLRTGLHNPMKKL